MKFISLAMLASVAGVASAQDILYTGYTREAKPVAATQVLSWTNTPTGIRILKTGKTVNLQNEVNIASVVTAPAFDGLEYDPAQIGTAMVPIDNLAYGAPCSGATGGARFFSGATVFDGGYTGEINAIPGSAGKFCNRLGFVWYVLTTATLQQCALIYVSDNFVSGPSNIDPNQAANRSDLGTAWLITYGSTPGGSAYRSDIDFGPGANGWPMPADGRGALTIVNGDYNSGTGQIIVGNSQMMRWVNKINNPTPADYGFCWRDRLVFNGLYDGTWNSAAQDEFENRASTACGGVDLKVGRVSGQACTNICASMLFVPPAVLSPTSLSIGLGQVVSGDVNSLALAGDGNALKICKAFVPNQTSPRIRFDADFLSPYLTPASIQLDLNARMTTGGVFKVRSFLADVSGADTFTFGAANQVIADTTINLTFAPYSSGSIAPGTHIDTDLDTTTDGTVRARVEIQQTGFSAVAVPCSEFDQLSLTVNP